jgi:hypothetical protein
MGERKPERDYYDIAIDIGAADGASGSFACAIVKLAYRIEPSGRLVRAPAVPLENDIRDPDLEPRLPPHTDFWTHKDYVDVGIIGRAHAPGGRPVAEMRVAVEIGGQRKSVDVLGDRTIEWAASGRPRIGAPEPFVEMPLDHLHAYGGCDFRVPFDMEDPRALGVTMEADHPGLYPRNPWGTGYLGVPDPIEGMRLPNLEDPGNRLRDDTLIADPEAWYKQPLPWYLDWTPINCFPRNMLFTIECDPWFPPPEDERLPEVRLGLLPSGYRSVLSDQVLGSPPHVRFRQEAAHGLVLGGPPHGARLVLEGMHPDRPVMDCRLPGGPPVMEMRIENRTERIEPSLTTVAIYPDQELMTLVYTAQRPMPRPLIPGIHKHIPVAVSVDGDVPVEYEPPETIKEKLKAAQEEKEK